MVVAVHATMAIPVLSSCQLRLKFAGTLSIGSFELGGN